METINGIQANFITRLLNEFTSRKARNTQYSLRAFARDLGVSKTAVSDVLSGKRKFSKQAIRKIADRLGLSPIERETLMNRLSVFDGVDKREYLQLQEDQFRVMCDWYYIGVLLLAQLKEHKANSTWISKKLAISELEARAAVATLERLGLVRVHKGKLLRTTLPVKTTTGVPSYSIRSYHKQNLRLAEDCLEQEPIERRIFSAISMPTKKEKLREAEILITQFKEKMAQLISDDTATDVYTLAIQLFPITRTDKVHTKREAKS